MSPGGFKPPPLNALKPLEKYKPEDIQAVAESAAERHGVPKDLLLRVVKQESSFRPDAISPKGAIGPMQLMPATAKDLGVDPHNVDQNVEGGARYLSQLLTRYNGDTNKALAAYNAGMGRVDSGKTLPAETQDYVKKISGSGATADATPTPSAGGFKPPPLSSLKTDKPEEKPQEQPKTWGQSVVEAGKDFLGGVGSGAFNTMKGASILGEKLMTFGQGNQAKKAWDSPALKPLTEAPASTAGSIGRGAEQMAEFFVPGPAEAKLASKIQQFVPRGLQTIARMASSAGTTGVVSALQSEGDIKKAAGPAAVAAGTTLVGRVLTAPMAALGKKIQASTIRPRVVDKRDGFSWDTVQKLGLKGNLEQSLKQVDTRLNELRTARNKMIAPGSANVDLHNVFDAALSDVSKEATSLGYGPMGKKAMEQIENMRADVADLLGAKTLQGLPVDVSKAENLKEFLGTLGSWSYGRGDPDAKVTELVANTLYSKVRQGIEKSLGSQGPQVKALNAEMQKIIPVKHAMVARLPVEERNRLFSLTDIAAMLPAVATGDIRMLGLEGLTRAQKSLRFGNWLSRNTKTQGLGRTVGGATQVASPWVVPPMP